MKKLLIGGLLILATSAAAGYWYLTNYGTSDYYTKITTTGQQTCIGETQRNKLYRYVYDLPGYDKDGDGVELAFRSVKNQPLKKNAYLVVHVNSKKGVMGWEEVSADQVPDEAKEQLH